jgi:acetolactate synthase I/II/III large subunit
MRTGGQVLADGLVAHGSELAFCVPGESYLALLDGLYDHRDALRIVNCRHEGAAANAADAYGKLTGRPGLCLVTRGPGATHAATGVHTARQDSTPLLLLVGQIAREERGRESFQELDYEAVFGPMAKWAFEIDDPGRIPEVLARAYTVATSGRPGPVVLSLPEDVLAAEVDVPDAPPYRAVRPAPSPEAIEELGALLEGARRPFVLVGGGPWDADSAAAFTRWALGCGLPVGATFRRQDVVDNTCASYAGDVGLGINPRLAQRIRDCDLLLAVGTRLTEIETQGYTLPAPPVAPQPLVHVHPDPAELGRVYQPALAVLSGVAEFAAAAPVVDGARWAEWTAAARADYEAWLEHPPAPGDGVDLGEVMAHLRDALPADAVITNGAGNFSGWVARYYQWREFGTQLGPQSGAMGYGIPAAVAAQLLHPERTVVAFSGDGDFQMCGQELATAVQERLPIVVLVVNNGTYGTIRMHQERRFPERVIATDLANPDFAGLARAYGAQGERIEHAAEFPDALQRARTAGGPALIELVTDPEALTTSASLSEIRAATLNPPQGV